MKKLIIFFLALTSINAESYKEISIETALKVNEFYYKDMQKLMSVPADIFIKETDFNETKKKIDKLNRYIDKKISISYGLSTNHVKYGKFKDEYKFNEDNNLLTLEYRLKNDSLGIATFKNSFYNQSYSVYYGHYSKLTKKLELNYKLGIIKGYNAEDILLSEDRKTMIYFSNPTVFYKDYSLMATVGLQYNFNEQFGLSVDLLSNAIESSVKYTF